MKRLLSVALWLGLIAPTFAQSFNPPVAPTTIGTYNGSELVRLTTNAGSAGNILLNHIRNTQGYQIISGTGAVTSTPTWYQTVNIVTSAPTTLALTLPNPAPDGMELTISNSTATALTTNVTVTANTTPQNQTLAVAYASQTLAANGGRATWMFNATNAGATVGTWYRVE